MAKWRQAVELALNDAEIEALTALSRSRTEPASRVSRAEPGSAVMPGLDGFKDSAQLYIIRYDVSNFRHRMPKAKLTASFVRNITCLAGANKTNYFDLDHRGFLLEARS